MSVVSIIIPSYNHEKFIANAVQSVLNQTHRDIELIVIDDGSSDDSLQYLRGVKHPKYQLIEQENAGAHEAINRGLALAQGDYLAILNSDDIFHPQRLAVCLDRMKGGADLVASWIEVIDQKGKALGIKQGWQNMLPWPIAAKDYDAKCSNSFLLNLLLSNFISTTSNVVFTRKLYDAVGGMRNLRFAHDWDFLLRSASTFRCELIETPLLQYRIHSNNTISSNRGWMLFEICWIYAVHLTPALRRLRTFFAVDKTFDEIDLVSRINLQNNDKLLWMLMEFLHSENEDGVANAALRLLDEEALRQRFLRHAVV